MWLLPQKRVLAPKISFLFSFFFFFFFFFLLENISSYTWWRWKKSSIEVSLFFGNLKMNENLEKSIKMQQKIWNSAQSEYYPPRHPGTYERIIIIRVTMRITDSSLLIPTVLSHFLWILSLSKLNGFVHLFHDQSVTNVKTIFVPNTMKLQFYCEYDCEHEMALSLRIIIITW